MDDYPLIADHGLIGDLQTCALVSTDGSIDWFCAPRFDSPSVFGALLDHERGGHFRVRPAQSAFETKQLYLPETAILITRFLTEAGVGEVIDFMPVTSSTHATENHRVVRLLRCVRGRMTFDLDIAPRFDYGRRPHQAHMTNSGAVLTSDGSTLTFHIVREPGDDRLAEPHADGSGNLHVSFTLQAGQLRGLVMDTADVGPPRAVRVAEAQQLLDDTSRFWRNWLAQSTYTGRWREALERSAITLKLMTYAPSGGLVAAPTAGLPEQVGGERNWDYRYTWIRDASFSVHTLLRMGFTEEAVAFGHWLLERVEERAGGASGPLNIMYRVDGSSDLSEEILDHWEGYRGSRPVRIGNGAADQLQLDIYGEALDSIHFGDQRGLYVGNRGWLAIRDTVDWLTEQWDQPEEGIWETRGGRQNFTYGRVMCWTAFDRAVRLATIRARPAPLDRWVASRDAVYNQVMERGWDPDRGAFVQQYGGKVLDSALLRMPMVGFVSPMDPMWISTLREMDAELVSDSLVYRYNPEASPDGLRGSEGTFSLCTFAYVDALARSGRLDEARLVFEKMLTYANHLGLYSEEIALTGEQIGNFPQAFTHLALIDAAMTLGDRLSATTPTLRVQVAALPEQREAPADETAATGVAQESSRRT